MRVTKRIEESDDALAQYTIMVDGEDVFAYEDQALAEAMTKAGNFLGDALDYADAKHGAQEHGSLTIFEHLCAVVEIVAELYERGDMSSIEYTQKASVVIAAAALHDVLEDTDATLAEITEKFGADVAALVGALTDGSGATRFERHLNTYWRIREAGPDAVLIKLCDRLHNHARSIQYREKYLEMYLEEYPYFKMALWTPGTHDRIWAILDRQYQVMKEIGDGTGLRKGKRVAKSARTGKAQDGAEQGPGKGAPGRTGL